MYPICLDTDAHEPVTYFVTKMKTKSVSDVLPVNVLGDICRYALLYVNRNVIQSCDSPAIYG